MALIGLRAFENGLVKTMNPIISDEAEKPDAAATVATK
jgi:hypothetical protein